MKLSTLIDALQHELAEFGDVDFVIQSEAPEETRVTESLFTVPVINKNTGRKRLIIIADPDRRIPDDKEQTND